MTCQCVCHAGVDGLWRAHVCEHCNPQIVRPPRRCPHGYQRFDLCATCSHTLPPPRRT